MCRGRQELVLLWKSYFSQVPYMWINYLHMKELEIYKCISSPPILYLLLNVLSDHTWNSLKTCNIISFIIFHKYKMYICMYIHIRVLLDFTCTQACLLAKLCPSRCNPMDYSPPVSSVHGISQARILEWVAISFTRGSFTPRDWTHVSCTAGEFCTA